MHVPWNWVKQRPQFLAEALSRQDNLLVFYPAIYRHRDRLVSVPRGAGLRYKRYYRVPFYRRQRWLEYVDAMLLRVQIRIAVSQFRPDIIWLPFAELQEYTPRASGIPVVYDCMDDIAGFDDLRPFLPRLLRDEEALLGSAESVLVSSEHLAEVLAARGCAKSKITLVRNACAPVIRRKELPMPAIQSRSLVALYYGGLATVDWKTLEYALQSLPELSIRAVGPLGGMKTTIPNAERLRVDGPVPFESLPELVSHANVLLMPFTLSDLIYSVDPVKLYEYIGFGKPIVCVEYPEVERFCPFVEFYRTRDEFVSVLKRLLAGGCPRKYSEEQRTAFLSENTWDKRAAAVDQVLEDIIRRDVLKEHSDV